MSALPLFAAPSGSPLLAAGYELGVGRAIPTTAALLGLVSVIVGGLALARARRGVTGRIPIVVALTLGAISVIVGGVHGANSAGGLNTGNGFAGAIFAVAFGLAGLTLGGLALARSRRAARSVAG